MPSTARLSRTYGSPDGAVNASAARVRFPDIRTRFSPPSRSRLKPDPSGSGTCTTAQLLTTGCTERATTRTSERFPASVTNLCRSSTPSTATTRPASRPAEVAARTRTLW